MYLLSSLPPSAPSFKNSTFDQSIVKGSFVVRTSVVVTCVGWSTVVAFSVGACVVTGDTVVVF